MQFWRGKCKIVDSGAEMCLIIILKNQVIKDFYQLGNLYIHTFGIGPAGGAKTIRVGIGVSHADLDSLGHDLIRQAITTSILGLVLALLLVQERRDLLD